MGRPAQFDRDVALRSATLLFWKRGYANTSLAQLLNAMNLGEGSFYNAFKSKKRLFLECLRHYNATLMDRRKAALGAERPAKARIDDFFSVVIDELESNDSPGCLMTNSLTHEVLSDRQLKGYVFGQFEEFLPYIASIVADGQERGELATEIEPDVAARVLFTYLHGLHRLSVFRPDAAARRAETQVFVDALLPDA